MDNTAVINRPRPMPAILWTIQAVTAAMFLAAGISKVSGVPAMVQMFDLIGAGQWFRYVTGAIEIAGAVLVLIPSLASIGAIALAATMAGAIVTHLFVVGGSPIVPILLLASTTLIAWARRT